MPDTPTVPGPPFAVDDIETSGFAGRRVTFAPSRTGTLHAGDGRGCQHAAAAQAREERVEVVVPADALTTGWEPPRHCCGGWEVFGPLHTARVVAADWRTLDELRAVLAGTPAGVDRLVELLTAARKLAGPAGRADDGTLQTRPWQGIPPQQAALADWATELQSAAPEALRGAGWLSVAVTEHLSIIQPLTELAALRPRDRRPDVSPAARRLLAIISLELGDAARGDASALAAAAAALLAERAGATFSPPADVDQDRVAGAVAAWRDHLAGVSANGDDIVVWRGRHLDPPLDRYQKLLGYAFDVVETYDGSSYGSKSYGFLTARLPAGVAVSLGRTASVGADPVDDRRVLATLADGLPNTVFAELGNPAQVETLSDAAHPRSLHVRLAEARAVVGVTPTGGPTVPATGQQVTATVTITFTITDPVAIAAAALDALVAVRIADGFGDGPPAQAPGTGSLAVLDDAEEFRAGLHALLTRAVPAPPLAGLTAAPPSIAIHGPAFAPPWK